MLKEAWKSEMRMETDHYEEETSDADSWGRSDAEMRYCLGSIVWMMFGW